MSMVSMHTAGEAGSSERHTAVEASAFAVDLFVVPVYLEIVVHSLGAFQEMQIR